MKGFIKAGLHRIGGRKQRTITLLAIYLVLGAFFVKAVDHYTMYEVTNVLTKFFGAIAMLFGVIEYIFVYADDIKSKTMQVAIGAGAKRSQIVLAEWLQATFLILLDVAVLLVILYASFLVCGTPTNAEGLRDICLWGLFRALNASTAYALAAVFVFWLQTTTMPMLIFLAAVLGTLDTIMTVIVDMGFLSALNLKKYLIFTLLDTMQARAIMGIFPAGETLIYAVEMLLLYAVTCHLFKKKELEF